jgi:hypothetical protein
MDDRKNLEKIIDSDYRVAAVETTDPLELTAYMKRLTLTTGRAVYDWSAEHGLYRLGIEHIFIPRTRAPVDVLSYITSSRHYGIYLLRDFNETLQRPAVERQLLKLIEKQDSVRRLVCLVGDSIKLPGSIAPSAVTLRWDDNKDQIRQA